MFSDVCERAIEPRLMDSNEARQQIYSWLSKIGNLVLKLLWYLIHFIISVYYFARGITRAIESNLISKGIIKRYKALDVGKIRYLAVVFDSEDARETSKIIELLQLLTAIGVKRVCLYDTKGVLKKAKDTILEELPYASLFEDACENDSLRDPNTMILEFASFSDGKEAVVKAANLLFTKYMKLGHRRGDKEDKLFTEPHMDEALKAVGCRKPDPDLMLVYGAVRCHRGFPSSRIRYTEIVHMGPLKSMRFGSLMKAIDKFTKVHQNYVTQVSCNKHEVVCFNPQVGGIADIKKEFTASAQSALIS